MYATVELLSSSLYYLEMCIICTSHTNTEYVLDATAVLLEHVCCNLDRQRLI